jgi:AcrR family transcriptional regulator
MPPALLSREEVVARLLAVIRRQGYDGASLAHLSEATGLGKSSLYHHFPNGKDDMVAAVLDHLEAELDQDVLGPLRAPGTPAARLRRMCEGLDSFFQQGEEVCLLASLAIGDSARPFHPRVREIFNAWIEAIAAVLREAGMPPAAADARAQDAVIRVEGALLLAHSLDDSRIFGRTIRALPGSLLAR